MNFKFAALVKASGRRKLCRRDSFQYRFFFCESPCQPLADVIYTPNLISSNGAQLNICCTPFIVLSLVLFSGSLSAQFLLTDVNSFRRISVFGTNMRRFLAFIGISYILRIIILGMFRLYRFCRRFRYSR